MLASPPTASLPIDVEELMEEPTPGGGVEGLLLGGSVGLITHFKSNFSHKKLLEVKFPSRWQMSSISEDESLELGGCWLELGYRSINGVPSDPRPLWYPEELKTISTERIRARYDWLV